MKLIPTFNSTLKRYSSLLLTTVCIAIISGACSDNTIYSQPGEGDGISVKVYLSAPAPSIAETRSVAEENDSYFNPGRVYLMVFANENTEENKDNNKLLQIAQATGSGKLYNAQLNPCGACYVYIVANAENIISKNKKTWEESQATFGDIKKAFKFAVPTNKISISEEETIVITEMIHPQPMMKEISLEKIELGTQIGSANDPELMKRSTVKITVSNETKEDRTNGRVKETLYGANLINAPMEGFLFSMEESVLKNINRYSTYAADDADGLISKPGKATENEIEQCTLYSFESVNGTKKPTALVVKATYGGVPYFYRINLNTEKEDYALNCNFHYIVRISAILREGCTTMKEATEKGTADNIEYIVNVTDDTSADIISDGEYYLGVSNSEFYALADGELNNIKISTISYNYPKMGSVEVVSGNITLNGGKSITLNPSDNKNNVKSYEVTASIGANYATSTIRIRFSDILTKDIVIYKDAQPGKFGTVLKDYGFNSNNYVSANVEAEYQNWLKLTTKAETNDIVEEKDLYDRYELSDDNNKDEKINIRVKANLGDSSSDPFRIGYVNYFRKDKVGNARILIKQPMHNVYEDVQEKANEKPYTYVGTFHRHDQVAERIIRIDPQISKGGDFKWKAFVIYGDFIRLSLKDSKDNINEDDFYGQGDNTSIFGAALEPRVAGNNNYLVEEKNVEISVEAATRIFFRVGLASEISVNSVRYGLIGLQVGKDYGTENITRYIFVRQGEEADYLMRPTDPIKANPKFESGYYGEVQVTAGSRPQALKFSPFTLTDPSKEKCSDLSKYPQGGGFTTYPSQAGYVYQALSKKGWVADPQPGTGAGSNPSGWDSTNEYRVWEDKYEVCPKGYERPAAGNETLINGGYITNSNVEQSPVRQSLWLYPSNAGVSQTQNFIIGYMADGFYDRQPMNKSYGRKYDGAVSEQPVLVNKGADIAYIGTLAFNPHTVASIFLPMSGAYNDLQKFIDHGFSCGFHTRTHVNLENGSSFDSNFYSVDFGFMTNANVGLGHPYGFDKNGKPIGSGQPSFRVDNYANHSNSSTSVIRCVKTQH